MAAKQGVLVAVPNTAKVLSVEADEYFCLYAQDETTGKEFPLLFTAHEMFDASDVATLPASLMNIMAIGHIYEVALRRPKRTQCVYLIPIKDYTKLAIAGGFGAPVGATKDGIVLLHFPASLLAIAKARAVTKKSIIPKQGWLNDIVT